MNYEKDCGPYKATRMWKEMIYLFQSEIPLKRHRRHIKIYENCFTGLEAISWFHNALQNTLQMRNITREQTIQLLTKFLKAGVYESISTPNGPTVLKEGELYRLKQTGTGFLACDDYPATQYLKVPLAVRSNNHENLENVNTSASFRNGYGCTEVESERVNGQNQKKSNINYKRKSANLYENRDQHNCNDLENTVKHGQNASDTNSYKWITSSNILVSQDIDQGHYNKSNLLPNKRPLSENTMVAEKQEMSSAMKNCKAPGNRDHMYTEGNHLIPLLPKAESWKSVVLCRLELMVPGITEEAKKVPAKWIAANATGSCETSFILHQSLIKGLQYLQQWPQAAPSGTLFAIEEYFKNLTEPLTTYRLYKPLTMVLSNLSSCKIGQYGSSVFDTVLPPNTCFETAFTSDSPITRIVPQSSFDTLHLKWCTRQKKRELTQYVHKFADAEGTQSHGKHARKDYSGKKRHSASLQCSNKEESQFECQHLNHVRSSSGGYVNPVIPYHPSGAQNQKFPSTLKNRKQEALCYHESSASYINPSITSFSGATKDASSSLLTPNKQEGGLQHIRNKSGGYVNPALDDMDEIKLDYDAALEYLQLLMRCSLEKPVYEDSGSESSSYYTAVSSSSSSPVSSRRSSHSLDPLDPGDMQCYNGMIEEKAQVAAVQLLLLCIPPYNRFQLRFLLQFIKYWNLDNPDMNVTPVFSSSVVRNHKSSEVDAENSCKILKFLTIHQDHILSIPAYLQAEVDQHAAELVQDKEKGQVTFCEQVSYGQFEQQKLTSSQQALSELLEQILSDYKMPAKEKRRRLRMFQKSYPHIYQRRFPESVEQGTSMKKQTKGILNFGKSLKSLRM